VDVACAKPGNSVWRPGYRKSQLVPSQVTWHGRWPINRNAMVIEIAIDISFHGDGVVSQW
jgi:hypothetical protein